MSPTTNQLIQRLSADLAPVEILPSLPRIAAVGVALALAVAIAASLLAIALGAYGSVPSRPGAWLAFSAHAVLAAGALAAALGGCVPGRASLERAGVWIAAAGLAGTAAMVGGISAASPVHAVADLSHGFTCLGLTLLPALVPAYFITRFISRGVPRRPRWSAVLGITAVTALVALPGHVACGISDPVHAMFSHLLAPLIGGLLALLWVPSVLGLEGQVRSPFRAGRA